MMRRGFWHQIVLMGCLCGAFSLDSAWACSDGQWFDDRLQLCRDAQNAFGPFPTRLRAACESAGGGEACHTNRWARGFTESLFQQAQPLSPLSARREVRGVYVSHFELLGLSDWEILELAQGLADANVNTAYVSVYNDGEAMWPSVAFAAVGGLTTSENYVRRWSRLFKSKGLHFVAWFESGLRLGKPDNAIAQAHPDWLQRDSSNNPSGAESGAVFLSPGSPYGMKVLTEMLAELAALDMGADEIQLDHFHWTHMGQGREVGYEACTRTRYWDERQRLAPADRNDADWVAFRESLLDDVVRTAYAKVKAANPRVLLSAVPEGSYALTKHMKRWPRWLAGNYIDLVMAQLYYPDLPTFEWDLRKLNSLVREVAPVERFGFVVDTTVNDPVMAQRMIALGRQLGVFNAGIWVYHRYSWGNPGAWALKNLATPQGVWAAPAVQPYSLGF